MFELKYSKREAAMPLCPPQGLGVDRVGEDYCNLHTLPDCSFSRHIPFALAVRLRPRAAAGRASPLVKGIATSSFTNFGVPVLEFMILMFELKYSKREAVMSLCPPQSLGVARVGEDSCNLHTLPDCSLSLYIPFALAFHLRPRAAAGKASPLVKGKATSSTTPQPATPAHHPPHQPTPFSRPCHTFAHSQCSPPWNSNLLPGPSTPHTCPLHWPQCGAHPGAHFQTFLFQEVSENQLC